MPFRNRREHKRSAPRQFDDETLVDRKPSPYSKTDPALDRLCKRVAEVIDTRLTAANEPALEECRVASVQPISGVRVLLVSLAPQSGDQKFEANQAADAAARAASYFRAEVAAALNRKHAPQLRFVVVPADWQGLSQGVS